MAATRYFTHLKVPERLPPVGQTLRLSSYTHLAGKPNIYFLDDGSTPFSATELELLVTKGEAIPLPAEPKIVVKKGRYLDCNCFGEVHFAGPDGVGRLIFISEDLLKSCPAHDA